MIIYYYFVQFGLVKQINMVNFLVNEFSATMVDICMWKCLPSVWQELSLLSTISKQREATKSVTKLKKCFFDLKMNRNHKEQCQKSVTRLIILLGIVRCQNKRGWNTRWPLCYNSLKVWYYTWLVWMEIFDYDISNKVILVHIKSYMHRRYMYIIQYLILFNIF